MADRTVTHSTFTLERRYAASPARVFAALSDPVKKRRWFTEGEGFEVDSFDMDFRVGGIERSRFRFKAGTPIPEGTAGANDSWYEDIVADRRIVMAYVMTIGGNRISASQATFELLPAEGGGTQLVFTEQAAFLEGAAGPAVREAGWRQLFDSLERELAR